MAVLDSPKRLQSLSTTRELAIWPFCINNKLNLIFPCSYGEVQFGSFIGPSYTTSNCEASIGKGKRNGSQFGHNRETKLRFSLPLYRNPLLWIGLKNPGNVHVNLSFPTMLTFFLGSFFPFSLQGIPR